MPDPVLETLLLPFGSGALAWPAAGNILFLRARAGAALTSLDVPRTRLLCRQSFRPFADDLARAGFACDTGDEASANHFPLILALPPRQRDEARFILAEAVAQAMDGGFVLAAAANNEGAKSIESDLALLAGPVATLSKHKCRAFWVRIEAGRLDRKLLGDWLALGQPRTLAEDARFLTRPGLFAWDRIDAGSSLLARHLPPDLAGAGADLGCGFGYLSAEALTRCAGITSLDLYEAERNALDLARLNLAPFAKTAALRFFWHDVTQGLQGVYDFIVSNPPFHTSRADRIDLGQAFITAGAKALKPGGRMVIVANRHLPYEGTFAAHFARHEMLMEADGYKIIAAVK